MTDDRTGRRSDRLGNCNSLADFLAVSYGVSWAINPEVKVGVGAVRGSDGSAGRDERPLVKRDQSVAPVPLSGLHRGRPQPTQELPRGPRCPA